MLSDELMDTLQHNTYLVVQGEDVEPALKEFLLEQGYVLPTMKNGMVCALYPFIFTVGIVCGIDRVGYTHRYCYQNLACALSAYAAWDGHGDPGGEGFIKRK